MYLSSRYYKGQHIQQSQSYFARPDSVHFSEFFDAFLQLLVTGSRTLVHTSIVYLVQYRIRAPPPPCTRAYQTPKKFVGVYPGNQLPGATALSSKLLISLLQLFVSGRISVQYSYCETVRHHFLSGTFFVSVQLLYAFCLISWWRVSERKPSWRHKWLFTTVQRYRHS